MLSPLEGAEEDPSEETRGNVCSTKSATTVGIGTTTTAISPEECQWLARMRAHPRLAQAAANFSDFDLLRWAHAHGGDVETAVNKCRRHFRIREILRLDDIEQLGAMDGLDEEADNYAPIDILGQVSQTDGRILLLERSGRFHLEQMMQNIRTSGFMLARFRLMERIQRAVRKSEAAHGRRQSAVLVLDMDGISFHAGLVSFISGPYRIMWGTLVEQYPALLSSILVLNCPSTVSVLWAACAPFLGDYRQRIHLLGRDWANNGLLASTAADLPLDAMPEQYGGKRRCQLREPQPCQIAPLQLAQSDLAELEQLSVPAGDFLVRTYFLNEGQQLEFVLGHEQALTMNMVVSREKRQFTGVEICDCHNNANNDNNSNNSPLLEEVLAGCERPGMAALDAWRWTPPRGGFFHLAFGNQRAWLLAVQLRFQLFELLLPQSSNGQRKRVRVPPIPVEQLLR